MKNDLLGQAIELTNIQLTANLAANSSQNFATTTINSEQIMELVSDYYSKLSEFEKN